MASTSDLITIANSPSFYNRVQYLAIQFALNTVVVEDSNTANHIDRVHLANDILNARTNFAQLALIVLSNPTIGGEASVDDLGASVPDSDITFQLSSVWTSLGVSRNS